MEGEDKEGEKKETKRGRGGWRGDCGGRGEKEVAPSYLGHNIKPWRWGYKVWRDDGGGEEEGKSDLKAEGISVTNLGTKSKVNSDQ